MKPRRTGRAIAGALMLLLLGALVLPGCNPSEPSPAEPERDEAEESSESPNVVVADDLGGICDGGQISAEKAYELLTNESLNATAIDIRRPAEYEAGHIPGSIYIGVMQDDFLQRLRELPREDTYIIICWHGNTSRSVVYNMSKEGFSSVCDVAGGYDAWRAQGLPLEEGTGSTP